MPPSSLEKSCRIVKILIHRFEILNFLTFTIGTQFESRSVTKSNFAFQIFEEVSNFLILLYLNEVRVPAVAVSFFHQK